jgi:hypothetical protein
MELREGRKGEKNDRATAISQNIASVKIEDIRMCVESC